MSRVVLWNTCCGTGAEDCKLSISVSKILTFCRVVWVSSLTMLVVGDSNIILSHGSLQTSGWARLWDSRLNVLKHGAWRLNALHGPSTLKQQTRQNTSKQQPHRDVMQHYCNIPDFIYPTQSSSKEIPCKIASPSAPNSQAPYPYPNPHASSC